MHDKNSDLDTSNIAIQNKNNPRPTINDAKKYKTVRYEDQVNIVKRSDEKKLEQDNQDQEFYKAVLDRCTNWIWIGYGSDTDPIRIRTALHFHDYHRRRTQYGTYCCCKKWWHLLFWGIIIGGLIGGAIFSGIYFSTQPWYTTTTCPNLQHPCGKSEDLYTRTSIGSTVEYAYQCDDANTRWNFQGTVYGPFQTITCSYCQSGSTDVECLSS